MSIRALISAVLLISVMGSARAEESPSPDTNVPPSGSAVVVPGTRTALDPTNRVGSDDEISSVYRDMGVVQRRAMHKSHRFLLATYGTMDFSDGPYTNYHLSVNPGYAISDFLEVYALISPLYFVNARSIVDLVSQLQLAGGQQASITAARPRYQYGIEVMWAPLYGKDSIGMSRIIRSDTFLKLGVSQIKYDSTNGMAFKLGAGKTFFLSRNIGVRFCVDYGYIQSVINDEKSFKGILLSEIGTVFYF